MIVAALIGAASCGAADHASVAPAEGTCPQREEALERGTRAFTIERRDAERAACAVGDVGACGRFVSIASARGDPGCVDPHLEGEPHVAFYDLGSACADGDVAACVVLSRICDGREVFLAARDALFASYRDGCPADPVACGRWADWLVASDTGADPRPFLEQACDGGDARSCRARGWLARRSREPGDGATFDQQAVTLLGERCDAAVEPAAEEVARACFALGDLLEAAVVQSEGSPTRPTVSDPTRAFVVMERACLLGLGSACGALGDWFASEFHGHHDDASAVRFWLRGCELGASSACFDAAEAHFHGVGIVRDCGRSRELYARGCSMLLVPNDNPLCGLRD